MSNFRERLRDRLRKTPLSLILALAVAVGASVIMVVQIAVVPPPAAIVAPIDTAAVDLVTGTHTVTFFIPLYYGHTALHDNLAAMGYVSLVANTTGWYYQVNDWIFTVVRRSTGNAEFMLPIGVKVEVYEYNDTHALVVNTQRHTVLVTRKVRVGNTGWYAYHPVYTNYESVTLNALTAYMNSKGLSYVYVFQPNHDYIVFDRHTKTFTVYFDRVTSTGTVTRRTFYLTNTTSFTPLEPHNEVIPDNTIYIITYDNVVLAPIWVIFMLRPTYSMNSALTITPLTPPQP